MIFIEKTNDFLESIYPLEGVIVSIDYGIKKVGFAISDENLTVAMAMDIIATEEIESHINAIINRGSVRGFVLGLPKTKDGTEYHPICDNIAKIAKWLNDSKNTHVLLLDERFSTVVAKRAISMYHMECRKNPDSRNNKHAYKSRKPHSLKEKIYKDDAISAQFLLQNVLSNART